MIAVLLHNVMFFSVIKIKNIKLETNKLRLYYLYIFSEFGKKNINSANKA